MTKGPPIYGAILGKDYVWWAGGVFNGVRTFAFSDFRTGMLGPGLAFSSESPSQIVSLLGVSFYVVMIVSRRRSRPSGNMALVATEESAAASRRSA